jgi:S1-C subfamily serine protease
MVVTSSGEVITNNHVIEGATSITATDVGNGKTYTAHVVGYDQTRDVAVIQLVSASNLTTVPLGDSSTVQSGQTVTSLGNAGGTGGTPSAASGSVTALGQSITTSDEADASSESLTGLIEFNGSLQPGDSGGPLVNSSDQVIGMDTAASSDLGFQSSSGQDYAIPINEVLSIGRSIVAGQSSSTIHIGATALIGVEISPNAPSGYTDTTPTAGAYVAGVVPGSSAANAGIAAGDTITAFNGQTITSATALTHAKDGLKPGAQVSITWVDGSGNSHTATITLTSGPAD